MYNKNSSGTIQHPEEFKLFTNPFQTPQKLLIKPETQVVFVADNFLEHLQGGAEFTTEALIEKCPYKFEKVLATIFDDQNF